MKRLKDKIAGTLYGVVTGDALGAPLEFQSKFGIYLIYEPQNK